MLEPHRESKMSKMHEGRRGSKEKEGLDEVKKD